MSTANQHDHKTPAWWVHVYGPDDLLPFSTELDALREANAINQQFVTMRDATDSPYLPTFVCCGASAVDPPERPELPGVPAAARGRRRDVNSSKSSKGFEPSENPGRFASDRVASPADRSLSGPRVGPIEGYVARLPRAVAHSHAADPSPPEAIS